MRRNIRLKEFELSSEFVFKPSDEYSNNSRLVSGYSYYHFANDDGFLRNFRGNNSKDKIFLLGDSSIENAYCNESSRINVSIQGNLNDKGYAYEILTSGFSGATSLMLFNIITNKIQKYKNSIIIFSIPSNDIDVLRSDEGYINNDKYFGNIIPCAENRILKSEKINSALFESMMCSIIDFCKNFNLKIIFTSIISVSKSDYIHEINNIASSIARRKNIEFIELSEVFENKLNLFYDNVHLNEEGSKILGNEIYKRLELLLDNNKTLNEIGHYHEFSFLYKTKNKKNSYIEILFMDNKHEDNYFIDENLQLTKKIKINLKNSLDAFSERCICVRTIKSLKSSNFSIIQSNDIELLDFNIIKSICSDFNIGIFLKNYCGLYILFDEEKSSFALLSNINKNLMKVFFNDSKLLMVRDLISSKEQYLNYNEGKLFLSENLIENSKIQIEKNYDNSFFAKSTHGLNFTFNMNGLVTCIVNHVKDHEKIYLSL